ncbi:MAG: hypothetical protein Q4D61_04580 [Cardiobacteriaceae bacterium]|nr:hypothetical protein [Cardiobacteriaceae bacterium]
MTKKVFISGSINIKVLPCEVTKSLYNIINNGLLVLVGDAEGIDFAVQKFFQKHSYNNVTVYSIYKRPRNIASQNFAKKIVDVDLTIKSEREKQTRKDYVMTEDSDFSLVVWDGESSGSYENIIRSIKSKKGVKVFLKNQGDFHQVEKGKVTIPEIESIYRDNNGFEAREVVDILREDKIVVEATKDVRSFNKFLVEKNIIQKNDSGVYVPVEHNEAHFVVRKYRGKISGLRYKNEFIVYITETFFRTCSKNVGEQTTLFSEE